MAREIKTVISAKDNYSKQLARAQQLYSQTGQRITTTFKAGALAIAGYAITLGVMIKTTADAGDAVQKMALRVGISAKALSELKHATELSGASLETLETGLRRMSKMALDADRGLLSARRSFQDLGVSVKDTHGRLKDADSLFMELAGSLNRVESETRKTALTQELFGKSGTMLLPLIREGASGIARMREEAELLGITFTDLEANQAAAFNDELLRTKGVILGVRNTIAMDFIPYATAIAAELNEQFIELRKSGEIDRWSKHVTTTSINTFETVALGAAGMADTINPVVRGIYGEVQHIWRGFQELPTWAKELGLMGAFMGGKKGVIVLGASLHLMESLKNSARGFSEAFEGNIRWSELATMNASELAAKLKDIDKFRDLRQSFGLFTAEEIEAFKGQTRDMLTALPDPVSYAGRVRSFFEEVRQRLAESGATTFGETDEEGQLLTGAEKVFALQTQLDTEFSLWEMFFERKTALSAQSVTALVEHAQLHAMAEGARANIVGRAYQSMENATLQLLETGRLSIREFAAVVAGQVKIELIGIAIRSGIQAIYQYAKGLAAAAEMNPMAALHFASARTFGKTAGMAAGGALATQVISGAFGAGTAERAAPGTIGGEPLRTAGISSPVPYREAEAKPTPQVNVTVYALDPSSVNWRKLTEENIAPALEEYSGKDGAELNINVVQK